MFFISTYIDQETRFRHLDTNRDKVLAKLHRFCEQRGYTLEYRAVPNPKGFLGTRLVDIAIVDSAGRRIALEANAPHATDWILHQAASLRVRDLDDILTLGGLEPVKPVRPSRKQLQLEV